MQKYSHCDDTENTKKGASTRESREFWDIFWQDEIFEGLNLVTINRILKIQVNFPFRHVLAASLLVVIIFIFPYIFFADFGERS